MNPAAQISKKMREDADVRQTVAVLKKIHDFGDANPAVPGSLSRTMAETGCGAKTYAVALMVMFGNDLGSAFHFRRNEFPKDIYRAWEALDQVKRESNAMAYVFSCDSAEARKLALAILVNEMQEERYERLEGGWARAIVVQYVVRDMIAINETALAKNTWRDLPPQLVQAYLSGVDKLAAVLPEEEALPRSAAALRRVVDSARQQERVAAAARDRHRQLHRARRQAGDRYKL
jgi:hypothetical protein